MFHAKTLIAYFFLFCMGPLGVYAAPHDCSIITNGDERLACFDSYYPSTSLNDAQNTAAEKEKTWTVIDERKAAEQLASYDWFAILPHKQNYVLPATHNPSADYATDYGEIIDDLFSNSEIKFQISLKTPIARGLWRDSTVSVGYTQQSYWQLFADKEISAPFRETNHEPEVMWEIPLDFELLGFRAEELSLAFNHQSNGRSQPLSRSWNRVTGEVVFAKERLAVFAKSWKRIAESSNDDNPRIEDYMGRLELGVAYKGNTHEIALGLKSSLGSELRNGLELDWTFPLTGHLRGFVQVYSGYGENLIDMENYNNRIGIGILLTDWL